jgi:hypothetical protein
MVLAAGISAVEAGEITLSEARNGIAEFYQNAVGISNATKGFLQLGVPVQQGYRTRIEGFGRSFFDSLGGGLVSVGGLNARFEAVSREQEKQAAKPLDLTKSTDVTLALTVMQSKKLANKIIERAPK